MYMCVHPEICVYTYSSIHMCVHTHVHTHYNSFVRVCIDGVRTGDRGRDWKRYWVATISKLLQIIGLFCKRALQKRLHSAKRTYNFEKPTNQATPYWERTSPLPCHLHNLDQQRKGERRRQSFGRSCFCSTSQEGRKRANAREETVNVCVCVRVIVCV